MPFYCTFNSLRPRQYACHFADDIFKSKFFYDFPKFNNEIGQLKINQYWFIATELATHVQSISIGGGLPRDKRQNLNASLL